MKPERFEGLFRDDLPARAAYAEGAGITRALPSAVAVPRDGDDVAALVRWAHDSSFAVVPRGSGSGMAGGAVGRDIIVDLSRLRAVGAVDEAARRMWVGPGALRAEVDQRARAHGLRFPVEPSSGAFCTVGGMAATNAAGARTLKYGPMRAWVTALDCVFEDGTRAIVRRGDPPPKVAALDRFREVVADKARESRAELSHRGVRKESAGYALAEYVRNGDLIDLLVGSEGTLAVFVALELALQPIPAATSSLFATFPSVLGAAEAAAHARTAGASACELLDRTFLAIAGQAASLSAEARAAESALLVEVEAESTEAAVSAINKLADAMRTAGATEVNVALTPAREVEVWRVRHAASPTLAQLDPSLKSMQFIEDACVPPEKLPDYVRGVRSALEDREIKGVIFGHAGDAHVHVNPLVDVRRPKWRSEVADLLSEVTHLVSRLGGTLSGEHGDGRLRAPLIGRAWGRTAGQLFRLTKRAFDPREVLNPGVKIPLLGQAPLDNVKYDPDLPPLPPAARAVLDRVERDRAYAQFRLGMLDEVR